MADCGYSSLFMVGKLLYVTGNNSKGHQLSIPQIVGTVWEACSSLKKTPGTNVTAIGRSITQVAVSINDVLREMKELKPASSDDPSDEAAKPSNETHESDNSSEGDLGTDLSPEDMKITKLAIEVVSGTLKTIKETIRSITGLLKNPQTDSSQTVNSLEKLLDIWKNMGLQVDEIGACLYPPQEVGVIRSASEKMLSFVGELKEQMEMINGCSVGFVEACNGLKSSLKQLELELGDDDEDEVEVVSEMKNLEICH